MARLGQTRCRTLSAGPTCTSALRSVIKAMGGAWKHTLSSPTTARWRLTSSPPQRTSTRPLFADRYILGGRPSREIEEIREIGSLPRTKRAPSRFAPAGHPGIVVLRAGDQEVDKILGLIRRLIELLETQSLTGTLWIMDERRVRIRR